MTWSKVFVQLDKKTHDRGSFDCDEKELNIFIQTKAAKHMQAGISRTMVLPGAVALPNQKLPICSFYSIAPSSICRDTLPANMAKRLPQYPVPVFLFAQLAVHSNYHNKGLGKVSMISALNYFWEVNAHMRAFAVVVDCLTPAAETFYAKYGFQPLASHNGRLRMFMPMKTIEQLFD